MIWQDYAEPFLAKNAALHSLALSLLVCICSAMTLLLSQTIGPFLITFEHQFAAYTEELDAGS